MAKLPYSPKFECEDANRFFRRMQEIDLRVAKILNDKHAKDSVRYNQKFPEPPALELLSSVLYRRPEGSGTKLDGRWCGPATVVGREGEHSYLVEISPGEVQRIHRSFLKLYIPDRFTGRPVERFFHRRTVTDEEAQPGEWNVEKIMGHKLGKDGKWRLLTHWEGCPEEDAQWEPIGNFIHRYSAPMVKYCKEHGIVLNLLDYLSPTAHVNAHWTFHERPLNSQSW